MALPLAKARAAANRVRRGSTLGTVPPQVANRSGGVGHLRRRTRAGDIPHALGQATRNAPRCYRWNAPRTSGEDVGSIDKPRLVHHGEGGAPLGSAGKVVG